MKTHETTRGVSFSMFEPPFFTFPLMPHPFFLMGFPLRLQNPSRRGGLNLAFLAYRRWSQLHGPEPQLHGLEGLGGEQLFFLRFAARRCGHPGNRRFSGAVLRGLSGIRGLCRNGWVADLGTPKLNRNRRTSVVSRVLHVACGT